MELLKVLKRNGDIVDFDRLKIEKAIVGAMEDLGPEHINEGLAKRIARDIERELEEGVIFDGRNPSKTLPNPSGDNTSKTLTPIPINIIEDRVEEKLMGSHCKDVARQYIVYRASKAKIRLEKQALDLLNDSNEELKTENSNKNTILNSTQRDYMAGILCKDISRNYFSKDLLRAHDKGMIHIHDLDFSPALPMFNCCLVNLDDMLENGTRLSDMDIVKPKSFMTACAVTAQIIFAVSGNQYGGQTISLSHLAPFVKISKEKYERKYRELGFSGENLEKLTEFSLKKEIKDGIQCLVYNVITMSNSNGQAPFLSIFLWLNEKPDYVKETAMLIEEMIQQRLDGFKDKNGRAVTIAFPKLLYVLDDNNTYPDSPYYYLTELAARCTAKRMVPDYISAKKMREYKEGNVFPCMGCRSFLQPYYDENNQPKFYGRFNQGVVTLNLPYVAMQSKGNKEEFWKLLEEATQKCYEALMIRHNRLKKVKSDVSPIHWQYGALARLNPGETIEKLLYNDYSSISLGYAGLYECTKYMTGYSHTDEHGHDFALQVMEFLNEKCRKWKEETHIGFSLYGTPLESTTGKFAKALQRDFGVVKNVSDHDYVTNSYHICVRENIDAFSKLKFEAEFQGLSTGGMISYIEVPSMYTNIDALLSVMQFIYENTMYAEINTKSDYCFDCGFEGEIESVQDENGKYIWRCPNCGNTKLDRMSVVRRTCGYIGSNYWNQARTAEIHDRVLHL
ncbi:anaerobic ribonucleoside-triphosphate reductase [Massilimicrobiota sp. An142]|uniref:anaerobic ribonucleoside-triphosphate reductase n=1 Tax=Massilimicrobiota sp. An142 TaxID=1965564 RepID=UPI0026BE44B7